MAQSKEVSNIFKSAEKDLVKEMRSRIQKIAEADSDILSDEEKEDKIQKIYYEYEGEIEAKWNNFVQIDCTMLDKVADELYKNASYGKLCFAIKDKFLASMDANGIVQTSAQKISKQLDVHINSVYQAIKTLRELGLFKDVKGNSGNLQVYIMSNRGG